MDIPIKINFSCGKNNNSIYIEKPIKIINNVHCNVTHSTFMFDPNEVKPFEINIFNKTESIMKLKLHKDNNSVTDTYTWKSVFNINVLIIFGVLMTIVWILIILNDKFEYFPRNRTENLDSRTYISYQGTLV